MYLFFGIFFLILLFFICFSVYRRKKIIKKICCMNIDEKCRLLNELINPFGYSYILSQDLFTSRIDAWQRDFGYCTLYDRSASHLSMIFDCQPVYFNYQGRTWLIEFWKGQYGINTGCEIGVYYAYRILEERELEHTLFHCVDNEDMPKISFRLFRDAEDIAHLCGRHWWLTAFRLGCFSNPSDLSLWACITFPTPGMAAAFSHALACTDCCRQNICTRRNTVCFTFTESTQTYNAFERFRIRVAQWNNYFWCKVYIFITRPFRQSIDRVLYLYYFLPFAFRRILRIRKYKKRAGRI